MGFREEGVEGSWFTQRYLNGTGTGGDMAVILGARSANEPTISTLSHTSSGTCTSYIGIGIACNHVLCPVLPDGACFLSPLHAPPGFGRRDVVADLEKAAAGVTPRSW